MEKITKINRQRMLLVALAFILPVVLAKFALEYNWFNKASTNKGQLITQPMSLSTLNISDAKKEKWLVLTPVLGDCLESCKNALIASQQVVRALGKEKDRVEKLTITDSAHLNEIQTMISSEDLLVVSEEQLLQVLNDWPKTGVYLADPMGNIMMFYEVPAEEQKAIMKGRDILSDLRKLLKLSRIG